MNSIFDHVDGTGVNQYRKYYILILRFGAKDAFKPITFPCLEFSNGLLFAKKIHFYCLKQV